MVITIDHESVEVFSGETILEVARRTGHAIPSLCYAKESVHKSSCMVCAVKNCDNGQIIPSCTTLPTEGMHVETDSEEVRLIRSLSLELLLSDHRADCDAPCIMVCPQGLNIERMLHYYDGGHFGEAYGVLDAAFLLPQIACDTCKAPCEKVCRRGSVDQPVSIRTIIREIAAKAYPTSPEAGKKGWKLDKNRFQSRIGRFTEKESALLKATIHTSSNCLHCTCAGQTGCKLRLFATEAGIKRSRYESYSALPAMQKIQVSGKLWFEQAKCIRCGLCVYNSEDGFTFKGRGFGMQVVIPDESKNNMEEEMAELCPTGALYVLEK